MFTSLDILPGPEGRKRNADVVKKLPIAEYSVVKKPVGPVDQQTLFVAASGRDDRAGGAVKSDMENTGIEPVTSWLQTRRSPS